MPNKIAVAVSITALGIIGIIAVEEKRQLCCADLGWEKVYDDTRPNESTVRVERTVDWVPCERHRVRYGVH